MSMVDSNNPNQIELLSQRLERLEFQSLMMKAEREFQGILKNSIDGVIIVLASEKCPILRVNDNLGRITGYHPNELLGKSVELLVPRAKEQTHVEHRFSYLNNTPLKSRAMGMQCSGIQLSIQHKDGTTKPVFISVNPMQVDEDNSVMMLLLIVSEVACNAS